MRNSIWSGIALRNDYALGFRQTLGAQGTYLLIAMELASVALVAGIIALLTRGLGGNPLVAATIVGGIYVISILLMVLAYRPIKRMLVGHYGFSNTYQRLVKKLAPSQDVIRQLLNPLPMTVGFGFNWMGYTYLIARYRKAGFNQSICNHRTVTVANYVYVIARAGLNEVVNAETAVIESQRILTAQADEAAFNAAEEEHYWLTQGC
ncbi:MAG: hypothetical protein P8P30_03245 [Rickettsiales bacterium]|nr:hypothetical protein [Rickettsiales bacterium]